MLAETPLRDDRSERKQNTPFGGTYRKIIPDRKIVYDSGFETEGAGRMLATVSFDEQGRQTTVTIHSLFESVAMRNSHMARGCEQDTNSGLDQLGELVEPLAAQEA